MKYFLKNGKNLIIPTAIEVAYSNSHIPIKPVIPRKIAPFDVPLTLGEKVDFFIERKINYLKRLFKWYFVKPKTKKLDTKNELFLLMGGKCTNCGFSDFRALQIDHVNSDGAKDKRYGNRITGNTYWRKVAASFEAGENMYQVLCANCNWIKRDTHGEIKKKPWTAKF